MNSEDGGTLASKASAGRRKAANKTPAADTTGARLAATGHKGKSSVQQNIRARSDPFVNRELALLAFNERVLAQAEDPQVPLLERLRYHTRISIIPQQQRTSNRRITSIANKIIITTTIRIT